jgi:hypothetical protein
MRYALTLRSLQRRASSVRVEEVRTMIGMCISFES